MKEQTEEQKGVMPIYLAKEVVISKESIESLSERLSEKIVDKLLTRIQSEESSPGVILKYHLREVLKKVGREEREVERAERIKRLDEININPFTIPEENVFISKIDRSKFK